MRDPGEVLGGGRLRAVTHERRRGLVAIALGTAAVLLAGCGGAGADEVSGSGPAASANSPAEPSEPAESTERPDPAAPVAPLPPGAVTGVVTNVVDGDTIDVAGVGRIRVIGIDTPERGACGYDSATYAMSVLVMGQEVTLVPGANDDADRYGRLLRYVDVGPVDAGLSLIEDGWAIARYDSRDGYGPHPREEVYVAADLAAPDLGCYPDDEP